MRFEPVEPAKVEPIGYRSPFDVVGNEVEPLAVAYLVETEVMGEAIFHLQPPLFDLGQRRLFHTHP
jgi:hypothetical protein